jgi:hypothetical protein
VHLEDSLSTTSAEMECSPPMKRKDRAAASRTGVARGKGGRSSTSKSNKLTTEAPSEESDDDEPNESSDSVGTGSAFDAKRRKLTAAKVPTKSTTNITKDTSLSKAKALRQTRLPLAAKK